MTDCMAGGAYNEYYNYNDSCHNWLEEETDRQKERKRELEESLNSASGVNVITLFTLSFAGSSAK
jgi:hypothetical protein